MIPSAPADRIGHLDVVPALDREELLAEPVRTFLRTWPAAASVGVAAIDAALADTAQFCDRYGVTLEGSANCVVVAGRRDGETTMAACVVLASTRADVNGIVRRHLGARKASFAAVDVAVAQSGMAYGGITPIGLPPSWPVLVDAAVVDTPYVVIGSGTRDAKLVVPGAALATVPGAVVLENLGRAVPVAADGRAGGS